MDSTDPRANQISATMVVSEKPLGLKPLAEIGCCEAGCKSYPTHVALVALTLKNGRTISMVRHFCDVCAVRHSPGRPVITA